MKLGCNVNKDFANCIFLIGVVFFIPFIKACTQTPAAQLDLNEVRIRNQMDQYRADMLEQKNRRGLFLNQAQSKLDRHEADVYKEGDVLVIRLKGLRFPPSVSLVDPEAHSLLSKVQTIIQRSGKDNVRIEGHTDSLGSPDLNVRLSKKRALAVSSFFHENKGGHSFNIETAGLSDHRPLATNATSKGRARNRRVEIFIFSNKNESGWNVTKTQREGWPLL